MKCTIVQCVGGWGGSGLACSLLLLPFWSRATLHATLKDLPPTQRCIDSVYIRLWVRSEALQLSSFSKKKKRTCFHPGGRAGFHCVDCAHSFDKMLDIAKDVVPVSIARIPMQIVGTGFREHLSKRIREHTCPQGVDGCLPTLMMVSV